MSRTLEGALARAEWITGLLLTACALYLHARCLVHAGPLWRDEVNTVAVATRASLGALAGALEHESFPILPFAVVRVWSALGIGATDFGLRILGFLVGAGILGALWLDARLVGARVPLLSLALFALNAVVIRWGDSLRAYGMGTLLYLLLFGAVFRACAQPDRRRVLVAAALALLAVQCMYQNALLLFATGVAAVLAAPRARRLRVLSAVCGVGALAAVSLLPYIGVIARARDHFAVITLPLDAGRVWYALLEALGPITSIAWFLVYAAAVALGIARLARRRESSPAEREALTYGLGVLLLAPAAIVAFLLRLSFLTEPWYFILLLGAVAVALDTVVGAGARGAPLRAAPIAIAWSVALVALGPVHAFVAARQTNVDVIARELTKKAAPEDLIIVDFWFYGISFNRYYRGATPWITVPPLADREIHRFDLVKEQMTLADPIRPIGDRIASTLRSGHAVWVVGFLSFPPPGQAAKVLLPAPSGPLGWYSAPYLGAYRMQVGAFLRVYGSRGEEVAIPVSGPVVPYEELFLWKIDGWNGPG